MGPELLPTDHNGDIGQDVSAAEAVEVEQHITSMASERNAAVCCTWHRSPAHKAFRIKYNIWINLIQSMNTCPLGH